MTDPQPPTATQDTDMENASNGEEQPSEDKSHEGNSDEDTAVQSTKDGHSGKSKMNQEHTAAGSCLQSENKQIYMDLHLNVPATPKDKGPPEVIATLQKRLLKFIIDVQGVRASFKLHTINPNAKNILTLDSPERLPETLIEIQNIFLNAKPLRNGGKLYMKVLVSHDCSTEALYAQTEWFHQEEN
jgi:hypothetical protein